MTLPYGYDASGDVTSETDKEGRASFTYDAAGQLAAVSGSRTGRSAMIPAATATRPATPPARATR